MYKMLSPTARVNVCIGIQSAERNAVKCLYE